MSISENTIQITYGDVTRPLTSVWTCRIPSRTHLQDTARVLHLFKDIIGEDYERYLDTKLDFNINKDSEATLTLPDLVWHFNIQTLGHGEIKVSINNYSCAFIKEDQADSFLPFSIKCRIGTELGISRDCIELCNEDGVDCGDRLFGYKRNMSLYATFIDHRDTVINDGHEILNEYDGKLKEGKLMMMEWVKPIGDYVIVRFHKNNTGNPISGEIVKRTPKMCKYIIYNGYDRDQPVENKKITLSRIGEKIPYYHPADLELVNYMENIDFNKTYAFPSFL